jgi:diketogulonate reductase-like aldo/keto reductase
LVQGRRFDHPSITRLAKKYNMDPAQILIRYSLQKVSYLTLHAPHKVSAVHSTDPQGYIPIPKSTSVDRIKSNIDVFGFELSKKDMDHLDSLNEGFSSRFAGSYLVTHVSGHLDLIVDWDPSHLP